MGNEQIHTAEENVSNEETQQQVTQNGNAEQTTSEKSGDTSGQTKSEQVDFSQMYDMLKERDKTIDTMKKEIADLKKTNTNLLLKVNASASSDAQLKTPYEKFIDSMVER